MNEVSNIDPESPTLFKYMLPIYNTNYNRIKLRGMHPEPELFSEN